MDKAHKSAFLGYDPSALLSLCETSSDQHPRLAHSRHCPVLLNSTSAESSAWRRAERSRSKDITAPGGLAGVVNDTDIWLMDTADGRVGRCEEEETHLFGGEAALPAISRLTGETGQPAACIDRGKHGISETPARIPLQDALPCCLRRPKAD